MDATTILRAKAALTALNTAGSMKADTIKDYVSAAINKPLTTLDGQLLIRLLETEKWVESYTHPIFKEPFYRITIDGQTALMAM